MTHSVKEKGFTITYDDGRKQKPTIAFLSVNRSKTLCKNCGKEAEWIKIEGKFVLATAELFNYEDCHHGSELFAEGERIIVDQNMPRPGLRGRQLHNLYCTKYEKPYKPQVSPIRESELEKEKK